MMFSDDRLDYLNQYRAVVTPENLIGYVGAVNTLGVSIRSMYSFMQEMRDTKLTSTEIKDFKELCSISDSILVDFYSEYSDYLYSLPLDTITYPSKQDFGRDIGIKDTITSISFTDKYDSTRLISTIYFNLFDVAISFIHNIPNTVDDMLDSNYKTVIIETSEFSDSFLKVEKELREYCREQIFPYLI